MRKISVAMICVLALLAATHSLAQDRGLTASAKALGGEFWQTRFERDLGSSASVQRAMTSLLPTASTQTVRLLSDYQFNRLRLGDTGGLRLTGGLLINLRAASGVGNSVIGIDNANAQPYAGVGYTSGSQRGAWGFSADLGLAAQGLGSVRLDRLLSGGAGLGADGAIRLQPVIRLGMSLAF